MDYLQASVKVLKKLLSSLSAVAANVFISTLSCQTGLKKYCFGFELLP